MENLISNYRAITEKIQPRNTIQLTPVLNKIQSMINRKQQIYYVAVLLVAGPIADLSETKEVLV